MVLSSLLGKCSVARGCLTVLIVLRLVTLFKADPDVLVGHDFLGVSLDVLLGRMKDLKVEHWSRLGRFRRAKWIPIGRQGTNIKFLSGRLLCDLASDGARVCHHNSHITFCQSHSSVEYDIVYNMVSQRNVQVASQVRTTGY